MTDDGTTEVTSCGSRTSDHGSSSQHRPHQQQNDARHHPALMAGVGEMSQHERASSWVDNLPTESGDTTATATAAGAARDQRQSAASATSDARSTTARLRDGAHDNHSSQTVSYDDTR